MDKNEKCHGIEIPTKDTACIPEVVGELNQHTANFPASAPVRTMHRNCPGSMLTFLFPSIGGGLPSAIAKCG